MMHHSSSPYTTLYSQAALPHEVWSIDILPQCVKRDNLCYLSVPAHYRCKNKVNAYAKSSIINIQPVKGQNIFLKVIYRSDAQSKNGCRIHSGFYFPLFIEPRKKGHIFPR